MSMRKSTRTYLFALLLSLCCVPTQTCAQTYGVTDEAANQNTPQSWAAVELPRGINTDNVVKITDYSASPSSADNHDAIQNAINAVAKNSDGGVVVIPAGTWLSSGTIELKSHTILHLAKGATLKLMKLGELPDNNGKTDYDDGNEHTYNLFIGITKDNVSDVIIEGEDSTSVIDGQGADWWPLRESKKVLFERLGRPGMIRFEKGTRTLVKNLKIINAPGTNLALGRSGNGSHMTVHDIWIREPASEEEHLKYYWTGWGTRTISHNTDGIPVWCPYVNIYNCDIRNGDDNVVIDSNGQYVHIWNCEFGTGHGASMGSYTSNVHHILWENINLQHTTAGIRLKTSRGRSGNVHDIIYRDITMDDVEGPISVTCYYDAGEKTYRLPIPENAATTLAANPYYVKENGINNSYAGNDSVNGKYYPSFNNILIQNVTATGASDNAIYLYGLPSSYINFVTFDNVKVTSQKGMFMAFCRGIKFVNGCKISPSSFVTQYNAGVHGNYTGTYANASSASTTTELGDELITLNSESNTGNNTNEKYNFKNGYGISNSNSKGYQTGKENTVKYSSGVQYTINLPAGVKVAGVKIEGYDNYGDVDSYLSELNGTSYNTEYVFPKKDASNYTKKAYTIPFTSEVTNSLTFKFSGKQVCVIITLYAVKKESVTLSASTNTGVNDESIWIFNNSYTITNTRGDRGYNSQQDYLKVSKGDYGFAINAPSGKKIKEVEITGYTNSADEGEESYLYKLGNKTYESNSATQLPLKNSTEKTISITLDNALRSVPFVFSGNQQVCVIFKLTTVNDASSASSEAVYLSDRTTVYKQVAVNPADVTLLGRGFVNTSWNTICLPFDVPAADLETYFGEGTQLAVFNQTTNKKDAMYFNTTDGGIEAGVPYLIKPGRTNEATTEDIVFKSVDLTTTEASMVTNSVTGYKFVGTYVSTALPTDGTGMFMVSGNKLRVATSRNNVMRGYRCYVLAPSTSAAKATRFVVEDAEATGISNVPAQTVGKAGAWYTLSGQRIDRAHLGRGIYIHGGKKVIIR